MCFISTPIQCMWRTKKKTIAFNFKLHKYEEKKVFHKIENFYLEIIKLCLVIVFIFYFQKLIFENTKKKQFSCISEIKNMFG